MKKRILFVDDEKCVLDGLKRSLYPMRDQWDMKFVESGAEALAELEHNRYDIIVSDMRMPGIDGSAFLEAVRTSQSDAVRFVLSGQAEQEAIVRAIGPTHQYLTKPCQPQVLKQVIHRACSLRERLANEALRSIIGRLTTIPSPSNILAELSEELLKEEPSLQRIADLAQRDIGVSCKVLQIVNSSFFGMATPVADVKHAVCLLGVSRLRPLFLSAGIFSAIEVPISVRRLCDDTIEKCLSIGDLANGIARLERPGDPKLANESMLAGIAADAGQLILASEYGEPYVEMCLASGIGASLPRWRQEVAHYGASHSDVGAYLLGIWGFSDPIVEAVSYHHEPQRCVHREFSPLTAVHAASSIVEAVAAGEDPQLHFHFDYLESIGMAERTETWLKLADRTLKTGVTT